MSATLEEWEDLYDPGDLLQLDDPAIPKTDTHHIWTECDGDDGGYVIYPGFHYVNRIGYFVTQKPWKDEEADNLTIHVPPSENMED